MRTEDREMTALEPVQLEAKLPAAVAREEALAQAEIKAAYTMALMHPRSFDEARVKTLRTCKRPAFADNKSVLYRKPVGSGQEVEGPGIRLAEELARNMGNIRTSVQVVADTEDYREVVVGACDLEANLSVAQSVRVTKIIERRMPRKGQEVIGQRQTSKGDTVYLVRATDEEQVTVQNAQVSKALRNCILRLVPQDLVEDAMATIRATRENQAAVDPDAARKAMCDAFGELNIEPTDLETYCGCPLSKFTPKQISDLRSIYGAIRDDETTWADVLASKEGVANGPRTSVLDVTKMKAATPLADEPRGGKPMPKKPEAKAVFEEPKALAPEPVDEEEKVEEPGPEEMPRDLAQTYPAKGKRITGMVAAFGSHGVTRAQLEETFGSLADLSHRDLDKIGEMFARLDRGQATWEDIAEQVAVQTEGTTEEA